MIAVILQQNPCPHPHAAFLYARRHRATGRMVNLAALRGIVCRPGAAPMRKTPLPPGRTRALYNRTVSAIPPPAAAKSIAAAPPAAHTPMMQQYLRVKAE